MDEERILASIQIMTRPSLYKVCEGCDSIVMQSTLICPSCKSYRFDYNEDNISDMAANLANNDQKTLTEKDFL
jgi:precorrin-6B methylase 2